VPKSQLKTHHMSQQPTLLLVVQNS